MLSSVLAYLANTRSVDATIHASVELARGAAARVQGFSVLDTRAVEEACLTESAAYAALACQGLGDAARRAEGAQVRLAQACREAELSFCVKKHRGDPRTHLPKEARFHDLVVACLDDGSRHDDGQPTVTYSDLADLVTRGVHPMFIVRPGRPLPRRVLLIYDGTEYAGRAIRSFLKLNILPHADCRLLVIGSSAAVARQAYQDMTAYCRMRRPEIETGWIAGAPRATAVEFARKWHADLAVLGLPRGPRIWSQFWGPPRAVARELPQCALFIKS
jgi:hypothetical protein